MISVITCTTRLSCLDNLLENYESQPLTEKELIIILNNNKLDLDYYKKASLKDKEITIYQLDEKISLGECLNFAAEKAKYKYITKFDDDDYYGPNYLTEVMNAFTQTQARVVGKATIYIYFKSDHIMGIYKPNNENRIVNSRKNLLMGATLAMEKSLIKQIPFHSVNLGEDLYFQLDCLDKGIALYSTSKSHYAYIRHNEANHHTSDATDERLRKNCIQRIRALDLTRINQSVDKPSICGSDESRRF